jgi:hypothetical protein
MEKNPLLEDELAFDHEFSEVRLVVGLEVKPKL